VTHRKTEKERQLSAGEPGDSGKGVGEEPKKALSSININHSILSAFFYCNAFKGKYYICNVLFLPFSPSDCGDSAAVFQPRPLAADEKRKM